MNDPESPTQPSRSSVREPVLALASASVEIATSTLAERGVQKLRILNEAKFLSLLREIAEPALEGAPGKVALPRATQAALSEKWRVLRDRHETALRQIEKRMVKLSFSFERLSDKLGRMEAAASLPAGE
jgi:hypothetical protein